MNWVGQETDYFKISDVAGYYPKMFLFGLAENQVFARVMKWIINTQIEVCCSGFYPFFHIFDDLFYKFRKTLRNPPKEPNFGYYVPQH